MSQFEDLVEERSRRRDERIWELVRRELNGNLVLTGRELVGGRSSKLPPRSEVPRLNDISRARMSKEAMSQEQDRVLRRALKRYDELAALGEQEVSRRYQELKERRTEAAQNLFITKKGLAADLSLWAKMPFWRYQEGAALIHGLDPEKMSNKANVDVSQVSKLYPLFDNYSKALKLAARSVAVGDLKDRTFPAEFLLWAITYKLPVSQKVTDAVASFMPAHGQARSTASGAGASADNGCKQDDSASQHVPKKIRQERAILAELTKQKYDPQSLPSYGPGRPGPKAAVKKVLLKRADLFTDSAFKKAWESLRDSGQIKDSE